MIGLCFILVITNTIVHRRQHRYCNPCLILQTNSTGNTADDIGPEQYNVSRAEHDLVTR